MLCSVARTQLAACSRSHWWPNLGDRSVIVAHGTRPWLCKHGLNDTMVIKTVENLFYFLKILERPLKSSCPKLDLPCLCDLPRTASGPYSLNAAHRGIRLDFLEEHSWPKPTWTFASIFTFYNNCLNSCEMPCTTGFENTLKEVPPN